MEYTKINQSCFQDSSQFVKFKLFIKMAKWTDTVFETRADLQNFRSLSQ